MTIPYNVQYEGESAEVESIIASTFAEVDALYNNWNPDSEVSQLNRLPGKRMVKLSEPFAAFLAQVIELSDFTDGRFDPALGGEIHLNGRDFWKEEGASQLDFGGVAKGYAVDLILERLQEAGYRNLYVEWGGEIRVAGQHPGKRPWRVAILGSETVTLEDEAIATSGSYLQNWREGDVVYTHINDPATGRPLANAPITSASVVASTCMEADAVATALMLFPSIEAAQAWAEQKGILAWVF